MNRAVVLVLAVGLAVAGCSTAAPSAPGPPAPSTPPAASAPAPPARPVDPALDGPLLAAATRGDTAEVRALLARGARVETRDDRGATPVVRAAYGNHVDTAAALTGAGANVNVADDTRQSAYLIATSEVGDDLRLLDLTLASGAEINARDRFDGTGLIRASERGYARVVDRLLGAGIDRDHINRSGYTALLEAVIYGDGGPPHLATVQNLVRGGVNVNIADRGGTTPLRYAERRGQRAVADVLRAAGAR